MKCIKCLTKPDVREFETERWHKCSECINGTDQMDCEDCGEILIYCEIVEYYHSDSALKACGWFKPK